MTAEEIKDLKTTGSKWGGTLKMYLDALNTLDDGPHNPSSV
ncbi:hypothetical protein [uncultured Roseovarius sp.]|nr:hypothetical protein [uncultured Roseovarius sp.]